MFYPVCHQFWGFFNFTKENVSDFQNIVKYNMLFPMKTQAKKDKMTYT